MLKVDLNFSHQGVMYEVGQSRLRVIWVIIVYDLSARNRLIWLCNILTL